MRLPAQTPSRHGCSTASRSRAPRVVVAPAVVLLAAGALAACGEEDDPVEDAAVVDEADAVDGPDVEGIVGLEVTAVGDVSEVIDGGAFRLDKDGLDPAGLQPGEDRQYFNYYHFDYYDEDELTAFDEELVVDEPEGVLVVVPQGPVDVEGGDQVRVSGTVRSLDTPAIEEAYGVELEPETFEPYENQLVIIAGDVSPAAEDPAGASAGGSPDTSGETSTETTDPSTGTADPSTMPSEEMSATP